jgi:hypothetical protein
MSNHYESTHNESNHFDIIIVGAGISGLYSAYLIQKFNPRIRVIVLERYKKKYIGGRIGNSTFHGVTVVNGAGVGRKNKDYLLMELLDELKVSYKEYDKYLVFSDTRCHPKKIISFLKKKYRENHNNEEKLRLSFKEFALPLLGQEQYNFFLKCSVFTDFENADVYDTLFDYGWDDNFNDWTALSIPWKTMIDKLCSKIGWQNIRYSTSVESIIPIDSCKFMVHIDGDINYYSNKVIIATTIDTVRKIIPNANHKDSIYQQIQGQTFLRLYCKFSKTSLPILKKIISHAIVVPSVLNKIYPIDKEKGIYMVYCDNKNADALHPYIKNTLENRQIIASLFEISLGLVENSLHITSTMDFYWPIGTHYYLPMRGHYKTRNQFIDIAQHPMPNMLVVGELISRDQGWSEGALKSVVKVVTPNWIKKYCSY